MSEIDKLANSLKDISAGQWLGLGLSGVNTGLDFLGQELSFQNQKELLREQQEFTKYMTENRYKMETDGMKKAGLNPALAGGVSGNVASTPSAPSTQSARGQLKLDNALGVSQLQQVQAQNDLIEAQAYREHWAGETERIDAMYREDTILTDIFLKSTEGQHWLAVAEKARAEIPLFDYKLNLLREELKRAPEMWDAKIRLANNQADSFEALAYKYREEGDAVDYIAESGRIMANAQMKLANVQEYLKEAMYRDIYWRSDKEKKLAHKYMEEYLMAKSDRVAKQILNKFYEDMPEAYHKTMRVANDVLGLADKTVDIISSGISNIVRRSITPDDEYARSRAREQGKVDVHNDNISVEDDFTYDSKGNVKSKTHKRKFTTTKQKYGEHQSKKRK